MLGRLLDYLFGYDFFISYSHADGKAYPRHLAQALTAKDFSVFLDEDVYAAGDELSAATLRRVGQSRRLVVVCGAHAVRSRWVRREVEAYAARRDVPLVIEWDTTLASDGEAGWLREMLGTTLTVREPVPRAEAPSPETIERLIRGFRVQRVERVRTALFAAAAVVFAVLAVVAWIQRGRAVAETRRAVSARLGMESSLILGRDPQEAVSLAECAMSEEPLLLARESLTAAVRATWGVDAVFRARSGELRDAVAVPSTRAVVAAGQAGFLWTWADGAAEPVGRRLLEEDLTALALTVEGHRLAVGSVQGKLLILDARTLQPALLPLPLHPLGISRILALGPRLMATVGYDSALVFFDPEDGKVIARPPVFHRPGSFRIGIQDASYDPVHRRIVTVAGDGRLALWDVVDPRRTRLLATAEQSSVPGVESREWTSVAVDPLRGLVAAGDGHGRLRLWRQQGDDLAPVELAGAEPPADRTRQIDGLAFDSEAGLLAVARSDGSLALWDVGGELDDGDLPGPLLESVAHGADVNRAVFTAPAELLTAADDGRVVRWRFAGSSAPPLPFRPARGFDPKAVLSANGAFVGSWDERNVVTVLDVSSRTVVGRISWVPETSIWTAAVAADGERLATGDEFGTVVVWATKVGRPLMPPLEIFDGNVTALEFDPVAGRWLVSGDVDGSVVLIRLDGGAPTTRPLAQLATAIADLAVSGDGSVVAAVSARGSTRLWRTQDWSEIEGVTADPESGILDAALDRRGQHLALADRWGAVLLWARRQGSWEPRRFPAHGGQVRALAFSADGKLLASGGGDGRIVVWSIENGARQWAMPRAHARVVRAVAWSSATALISVGDDGSVASWPFATGWWMERAARVAPSPSCPE